MTAIGVPFGSVVPLLSLSRTKPALLRTFSDALVNEPVAHGGEFPAVAAGNPQPAANPPYCVEIVTTACPMMVIRGLGVTGVPLPR